MMVLPLLVRGYMFGRDVSSTTAIASVPSLTTLPPAIPTNPSAGACNFTDRSSLLSRVQEDWQGYNLSLLVQTCSSVCPLVYGSGNPDLSGIGAMVSYCLQVITTFLFSIVLGLAVIISEFDPSRPRRVWARLFHSSRNLGISVVKTNIFISLSIEIACLIRTFQVPPVSEQGFIDTLGALEVSILLGAVGSFVFYSGDQHWKMSVISSLYTIIVLALAMVNSVVKATPGEQIKILKGLTTYCISERDYAVEISFSPFADDNKMSWKLIYRGMYIFYALFALLFSLLLYYFFDRVVRLLTSLSNGFLAICQFLYIRPSSYLHCVPLGIIMTCWVYVVMSSLLLLEMERRELKAASGPLYQDSEWGFGQVTMVFAWAPLLHDILSELNGTNTELTKPEGLLKNTDLRKPLKQDTPTAGIDEHLLEDLPSTGTVIDENRHNSEDNISNQSPGIPAAAAIPAVSRTSTPQLGEATGSGLSLRSRRTPANQAGSEDNTESSAVDTAVSSQSQTIQDDIAVPQMVAHRLTWPRNEDGTYLPTSQPASPI